MTTSFDRRVHQLAQAVTARAWSRSEAYDLAQRRQPRNGHRADCPDRLTGHTRRCRHCRADVIGAEPKPVDYPAQQPTEVVHPAEERACPRCYAPTTDPEGHCT